MSYDYQQDPNQQGQQYDQNGNPVQGQGQWGQQDPNQQGNSGQQQDQWSQQNQGQQQSQGQGQQYDQNGNPVQGQDQQGEGQDPFGGARQMAGQQVDRAIDQFAGKIPGGQQYAQQAKDAASGILGNLESEAEQP